MLKYVRGGLETSRSSGAATVLRLLLELGDLTLRPPHLAPVAFRQCGHQPEAGQADAGEPRAWHAPRPAGGATRRPTPPPPAAGGPGGGPPARGRPGPHNCPCGACYG